MKLTACSALVVVLTTPLAAQQTAAPADFAASVKKLYNENKGYLFASADKWPADQYAWRPAGLEAELRTFGQLIAHTANDNTSQCARANGKTATKALDDKNGVFTKSAAIAALKDAFAACDPVYNSLTDQSILEVVTIPGSTRAPATRGATLVANLMHNNDQYARIMVYFAMKGMVPPSHEK